MNGERATLVGRFRLVHVPETGSTNADLVAAAHRESVLRILEEIRAAQERLATGRFGRCESCGTAIPLERLELRPWTTLCVGCAPRS